MTRDATADAILTALAGALPGIADTFGRTTEVVLHDYRKAPASVVAVAGNVTNRHADDAISEIGLRMLAQGDEATNDLNYITRTPTGKIVKSSTLPLRDGRGRIFGALCINIDVTALRQAGQFLAELGSGTATHAVTTTFTNDFDDVVDAAVRAADTSRKAPGAALSTSERLAMVRTLDERGIFTIRGAVPRVAARLGISRASVYSDLAKVRDHSDARKGR